MAHPQQPESGRESPGYYILVEDSSTQTTERDFFILEHTRDASTQTTERDFFILENTRDASTQTTEEFISQETTRDASTQTPEDDLSFLEQPPVTSETSKESRKRRISNEQEVTRGSDACKLPRTEICGMSGNENPGYNLLLEPQLRTSRGGRTLTAEEFISQETTGDTSTLTPEDDLSFFEQPPVTSETSDESRKRKISNEQEVTHGSDVGKLPRTKTSELGDKFFSSSNEKGFTNQDSLSNIIATPNQIAFESIRLRRTNPEVTNPEESLSQNQDTKVPDYLGNTKNPKNEHNTASNKNIYLKENVLGEMPGLAGSKIQNVIFVDDMFTVEGLSHSGENISQSNLCKERLENRSPVKLQPLTEIKQKESVCVLCQKKTISEHVEVHDGNNMYKCCQCKYRSKCKDTIMTHISSHPILPFYCDACKLSFSEKGAHDSNQTCDVCNQSFHCKNQLEKHYYSKHEPNNENNCRICQKEIREHISIGEKGKIFVCCYSKCEYRSPNIFIFKNHLYTHFTLYMFECTMCEMRFKKEQGRESHMDNCHPLCKLCCERFLNSYFLEQHRCEDNDRSTVFQRK